MKRIGKILLIIIVLFIAGHLVLWLLLKKHPQWDNRTGHNIETKIVEREMFTLTENIEWAAPKGFKLTLNIYTPKTARKNCPVIVIFHGGAWLINDKGIMSDAAAYLASSGKYVVCNVNYRLLRDLDNTVRLNEIIEDVFGSILWIKSHIANYNGDANRIIVTGDSAGGHLAAIATLQGDDLSSKGFSGVPLGFNPTWLPPGKTAEDIARDNGLSVKAAILNYSMFNFYSEGKGGIASGFESPVNIFWALASSLPRSVFGKDIKSKEHPDYYKKVSPYHNIPKVTDRPLPPLLFTVGEKDPMIRPSVVKDFVEKLKAAGHKNIEYWEYEGQAHAYLDSGEAFNEKAPPALNRMLTFLDGVFYAE